MSGSGQQPDSAQHAISSLTAARERARRVLITEQLIVRLTPAACLTALYILAGLLRIPQSLPDWLHLVIELTCFIAVVLLARRGLRGYRAPSVADADRRLEQASHLAHHPLTSLTDTPSAAGSAALWPVYQERVAATLGPLRAGWPHPSFERTDPRRAAVLVIPALCVAGFLAGGHAPGRVAAALIPGRDDPDVPLPHVEAWITPPSYAPSAPVFLKNGIHTAAVPDGSLLTVTVTDARSEPALSGALNGEKGHRLDSRSWRIEGTLKDSGWLSLRSRGRTVARWNISVAPDAVPFVAWGDKPGGEKNSRRTRIPFEARHAYGLESLVVEMRLKHPSLFSGERVLRVPLPITGHPVNAKGTAMPDLSSDPWAGEEVSATLVATSVSHQVGRSTPVTLKIGSRRFRSPEARAVLDLRRRLALGKETRTAAADDLMALGETPGPLAENTGMFLNLSSTASLLANQDVDDGPAVEEATGRLWDLALDLEDRLHGGPEGALASIDVRAAQEAVEQQLKHMREDNAHTQADKDELHNRMEALNQAISRKMQALAQQALKDHTAIPDLPGLTKSGDKAFRRLMQQLQEDAAEGRENGAMNRMQQLEDSIERMRNATPQDMAKLAQQLAAQQKLKEQVEGLQDLVRQQRSLLDHAQSRLDRVNKAESRQAEQNGEMDGGEDNLSGMSTAELLRRLGLVPPPGTDGLDQPPPSPAQNGGSKPDDEKIQKAAQDQRQDDKAAQHALMRATDELQQEFRELSGKQTPAFEKATAAMHDARHALAQNNDGEAVTAEQKALEALQQGRSQMRQELKSNGSSSGSTSFLPSFSSGEGKGDGQKQGSSGSGDDQNGDEDSGEEQSGDQDPLGRPTGEGDDSSQGNGGHIPDAASRERAHEIEEELRRRDSDRTRPPQELDYLDRLLKSF